jgi:uncharacterized protein (DUF2336 family)
VREIGDRAERIGLETVSALAAHPLIDLAQRRAEGDRNRLLLAMVDLCASSEEARRPELRALLGEVFVALAVQAEHDIREALAERLAAADWAPKALIDILVLDDIEIARPLIRSSPLLQEEDLLLILVRAAIEHQIEVARRPGVGPRIVEAILDRGEPSVMAALAANTEAEVSEEALRRLVAASRRIAALRAPLARHPRLTRALALQLYAWVGEALRTALCDRFQVDADELRRALGDAVAAAHAGPAAPEAGLAEQDEAAQRLVAKLDAAGELRPGYLVRALKEGKLPLFQAALAALGDFQLGEVRRACAAADPELIALACAAVGIDRVVFPTLLVTVRELNGGRPGGGPEAGRRAAAAFTRDPANAAKAFRDLVAGV